MIRFGQEASFLSGEFRGEDKFKGIKLQLSGIENQNAIGPGKTFHHSLPRIYSKLKIEHPKVPKEFVVRLSIKTVNDTRGPSGIYPPLLVFDITPSFTNRNVPAQAERMRALACAQKLMESVREEERIRSALASEQPPATRFRFGIGDHVMI